MRLLRDPELSRCQLDCDECGEIRDCVVAFDSRVTVADGEPVIFYLCFQCLRKACQLAMPDGPNSVMWNDMMKALRGWP